MPIWSAILSYTNICSITTKKHGQKALGAANVNIREKLSILADAAKVRRVLRQQQHEPKIRWLDRQRGAVRHMPLVRGRWALHIAAQGAPRPTCAGTTARTAITAAPTMYRAPHSPRAGVRADNGVLSPQLYRGLFLSSAVTRDRIPPWRSLSARWSWCAARALALLYTPRPYPVRIGRLSNGWVGCATG